MGCCVGITSAPGEEESNTEEVTFELGLESGGKSNLGSSEEGKSEKGRLFSRISVAASLGHIKE